ncbi:hypothetical protein FRC07_004360 [Ceratobasidium sp. 392]|nr:hypothetical protein FRC07_004360 [Ceratobasidium sp. 392]
MPDNGAMLNPSAKSVPATPISARQSISGMSGKPVGLGSGDVGSYAQEQSGPAFNMNRLSGAYDVPVTFNSVQGNKDNFVGNINGEMGGAPTFGSYDYEGGPRNGCRALRRGRDSSPWHIQLVTKITFNALTLVQDPYGNYAGILHCIVVQYILDLNDNRFSDAVIRQLVANVCVLSVQKFNLNMIANVRHHMHCYTDVLLIVDDWLTV